MGYMYNMLTCDMEFPNIELKSVLLCFSNRELHFDIRHDHILRKYTIPLLVHVIRVGLCNYNHRVRIDTLLYQSLLYDYNYMYNICLQVQFPSVDFGGLFFWCQGHLSGHLHQISFPYNFFLGSATFWAISTGLFINWNTRKIQNTDYELWKRQLVT